MKDYSVNEEERKDFVLGFEETEDELYVNFAGEKEPWPLPNEEKNRQKLLDKMHDQVQNSGKFERNNILNKYVYMISTITCMLLAIFSSLITLKSFNVFNISLISFLGAFSVASFVGYIKANSKLKDLRKNKAFIEMEEELNSNIRKDNNTLANVSSKTKGVIEEAPEGRPVFDINSFNNVSFKDLEQMKANIDRNKRFGFVYDENASHEEDYSEEEKVQNTGMTRKRER